MADIDCRNLDDLEMLNALRDRIFTELTKKQNQEKGNEKDNEKTKTAFKVGDLLKTIELKNKLSVSGKAEKKFWKMINQIREEDMEKSPLVITNIKPEAKQHA